ncbi:MAG: hypothetical protein K8R88_00060 [Armatimonadetes bacterium]|nr:hypothetical protein [Armatimonadota bacterium]
MFCRTLKLVLLAGVALGAISCAKFPATGGGTDQTRLLFSMTMDGPVRFGTEAGSAGAPYIYMVAIRTSTDSNPIDQGPIPIISSPWGNGFVAGNATHFVWWDPTQSASQYTLYRFNDATLQQWFQAGIPVGIVPISVGEKTLKFELNLSQLEPDPLLRPLLKSIQVNFLTMDRIPQTGSTKFWDALGDSRNVSQINQWITISLANNGIYDNQRAGGLEVRGDQVDPTLDLVDWSVEVSLR